MILYYTKNGNSQRFAEEIAKATSDQAVNIEECVANGQFKFEDMDVLGLVVPEYKAGMPASVDTFLKELIPLRINYMYLIVAFDTKNQATTKIAQDYMKAKGREFDAFMGVNLKGDIQEQVRICRKYIARQSKGDFVPKNQGFFAKLFGTN